MSFFFCTFAAAKVRNNPIHQNNQKIYYIMAEKQAPNADKLKALQAAMAKIDKNYGKGAIMKLGDENIENVPVIPTGSLGVRDASRLFSVF